MIIEAHQIAAGLAAASEVFPIKNADDGDSRAHVMAERDVVISVVVTGHLGRAKREYRVVIQCAAEDARNPSQ